MRSILNKIKKVVTRSEAEAETAVAERGPEDEQARQKAEAAAMLRDFVEANMAILNHDPGPLPQFEAPVRLRPVMPLPGQEVSGSWIGGLPMLPEAMPWPILADKPALFLAQIDCTELPQGIWGGMGPRDGWLVFFVAQDHRVSEVCVRHVDGPLAEREPPEPLDYPSSSYASAPLAEWIRPELGTVPRWPVVVEPIKALPEERGVAQKMDLEEAPRRKLYADLRLRDELMPFDWTSALLLLYAADEDLERWDGVHGDRIAKAQAEGKADEAQGLTALQTGVQAARAKLARLIAGAEDASERVRFTEKAGALIVEGLRRIRYPIEVYRDGVKTIWQTTAAEGSTMLRNYITLAEIRARELYCTDPTLLPPRQRAHFENIWTFDAEYEHGHMGGQPGFPFRNIMVTDPVALLILPTSDLIGWMWGDMDDLGIFIPPAALEAGDWDAAEGAASNG